MKLISLIAAIVAAMPAAEPPKNLGNIGAGEGPAWHPEGALYFTGRNQIVRRDAEGKTSVFRPDAGANGLLVDPQRRLNICESRNRRITRLEANGEVTVLADRYEGRRFNSPNDLTIDSRGRIYFSDPRYGSRDGMEMDTEGVYRIDAPGKVVRVLGKEVERANGVLVSPKDEFIYVADNNNNTRGGARKLWRFRLRPDGSVDAASKKLIFDWQDSRGPDGLKMDRKGLLYVAGGRNKANEFETDRFKGGVYVLSANGKLLDTIPIPVDEVTNCAFGGVDLKTLFITAGGTLWSVPMQTAGRVPFQRP